MKGTWIVEFNNRFAHHISSRCSLLTPLALNYLWQSLVELYAKLDKEIQSNHSHADIDDETKRGKFASSNLMNVTHNLFALNELQWDNYKVMLTNSKMCLPSLVRFNRQPNCRINTLWTKTAAQNKGKTMQWQDRRRKKTLWSWIMRVA